MGHLTEELNTLVNLFPGERDQALGTEALDGKAAHHSAIEHSPLQHLCGHRALRSDVPQKAAGKGVTRARRIVYLFQRQGGRAERMPAHPEGMVAKEDCRAILAVLYHQRPWPFVEDPAGSAQQVVLAGNLPRL